ncbi:MAG TPA: hypothetical protein VHV31_11785 [Nitrolancea sp.]|jgi:hypothetical protein|nr:hypothetical protein [Nitrolancea sp.]
MNQQPEITTGDLSRIYIVVPREDGVGTINLTVAQMTDRQFREWIRAKAEISGVKMIVPIGRIGYETRVYMLNRLVQAGVRIYMTPKI